MIFIVFYSMYFYVLLINMFVSTAIAQIDVYRFTWKWVNIVAELLLFVIIQLRLECFPSRNISTKECYTSNESDISNSMLTLS